MIIDTLLEFGLTYAPLIIIGILTTATILQVYTILLMKKYNSS